LSPASPNQVVTFDVGSAPPQGVACGDPAATPPARHREAPRPRAWAPACAGNGARTVRGPPTTARPGPAGAPACRRLGVCGDATGSRSRPVRSGPAAAKRRASR